MARDAVAVTALPANTATGEAAGTAIVPANGAAIAAGSDTQKLLIHIQNTYAGSATATIKAGANPPAVRAGLGDLSVGFTAAGEKFVVIESARFAQASGDVYIDFTAGMTGTVAAYRLAKGV